MINQICFDVSLVCCCLSLAIGEISAGTAKLSGDLTSVILRGMGRFEV